jgi:hypothetical protein
MTRYAEGGIVVHVAARDYETIYRMHPALATKWLISLLGRANFSSSGTPFSCRRL